MLFLGLWVGTFKGVLQLTKMKGFILDKRAERRLEENRGHKGKTLVLMIHLADHPSLTLKDCHQSHIEQWKGKPTRWDSILPEIREILTVYSSINNNCSALGWGENVLRGLRWLTSVWLLFKSILRKKWGRGRGSETLDLATLFLPHALYNRSWQPQELCL